MSKLNIGIAHDILHDLQHDLNLDLSVNADLYNDVAKLLIKYGVKTTLHRSAVHLAAVILQSVIDEHKKIM